MRVDAETTNRKGDSPTDEESPEKSRPVTIQSHQETHNTHKANKTDQR